MDTAKAAWQKALEVLAEQVSRPIFSTWLADTKGKAWRGDALVVEVPTEFVRDWLDRRMSRLLEAAASETAGRSVQVQLTLKPVSRRRRARK